MPTYDKDGHLYGDAYFNAEYFHVGNEAAEKTYINMENEELEIHNLVEPTEDNDAATKKYVDDNAGGGGGGSNFIVYDGQTAAELAAEVQAKINAGISPAIREMGSDLVYHLSSITTNQLTFFALTAMPTSSVQFYYLVLAMVGDAWQIFTLSMGWEGTSL